MREKKYLLPFKGCCVCFDSVSPVVGFPKMCTAGIQSPSSKCTAVDPLMKCPAFACS